MDLPLSSSPPRPPSLNLDILSCILPFLSSSPTTLASIALVSTALYTPATKQLYHSIELRGSPRTYQLFFEAHTSCPLPPSNDGQRISPLSYAKNLYLGRHFLPRSSSSKDLLAAARPSTSLYTVDSTLPSLDLLQLPDLLLPSLPPNLFPNLQTLHLDVHRTHLASILPILIAVNPYHLVLSPHPPASSSLDASSSFLLLPPPHRNTESSTAIAYLPLKILSSYTNLLSSTLLSTDLHPPDESDYPPYSIFPFPASLATASLERVKWVYTIQEMRLLAGSFFQNLEGLLDWEGELEIVLEAVEVRVEGEQEQGGGKQQGDGWMVFWKLMRRSLQGIEREREGKGLLGREGEKQGLLEIKRQDHGDGFEEGGVFEHGRWEVKREEIWRFREVRVKVREVVVWWEK